MTINIDIDNIVTDLNGKADKDLTNAVDAMSTSAKSYFCGLGMPSDKYVELTISQSGVYIAPANGWFALNGKDGTEVNEYNFVLRHTQTRYFGISNYCINQQAAWCNGILPTTKGTSVGLYLKNISANTHNFRFYYAQGSESEV